MVFKGLQKRGRIYTLSGVYCDNGSLFSICRNAFMMFFGLGGGDMKTIENSVSGGNMVPVLHGLYRQRVGEVLMEKWQR